MDIGKVRPEGDGEVDEWQVIDQVLGHLSQYNGSPDGNDAEEVLPLIDALRRAIAIVQGRFCCNSSTRCLA
eukprot:g12892.t1